PPLFYLVAAPIFRLGLSEGPVAILLHLRALDAVLGAITLLLAFAVARRVVPRELALAVPLTMVGVPMFTSESAALSADPLANLLSVAILLLLAIRFDN